MTEPRPSYDPRQLDIANNILTDEMEEMRSRFLIRLAKEFNIFDAPDTLRNIKKLVESDIILAALQDYTNRKYPVLTICGSVRLGLETWQKHAAEWTRNGWLVHYCTIYNQTELHDTVKGRRLKEDLDAIYKQRIRSSNAILVLNVDGYIGKSTRSEIEYAKSLGKKIHYLEPVE